MKHDRAHLVLLLASGLSLPMLLSGCAAKRVPAVAPPAPVGRTTGPRQVAERLVTRRASITVRVPNVAAAAGRIEEIVGQEEGIVAESSRTDDDRASFILRVPSARLEDTWLPPRPCRWFWR